MTIPAGYRCNQWGWFFREDDNSGPYYLDKDGNMSQWTRSSLMTDNDGPYARLRVDVAQTGFFAGRIFRTFHEFNIAAGASQWLRFITPLNVIIQGRDLTVVEGSLRFALSTGNVPAGVWTDKPVFPVNAMSGGSGYVGQVTAQVGGTATSGTERDVMLLEAGNNNQATTVILGAAEVGLPASTYYVELRNTGSQNVRGLYRVIWEERP